MFALRFEGLLQEKNYRNGVKVYIGNAHIVEVEEKQVSADNLLRKKEVKEVKPEDKQLSFEDFL